MAGLGSIEISLGVINHDLIIPDDFTTVIKLVVDEYISATNKFGPFNSCHEGYGVILEELDEAWAEIKANKTENAKREMLQVAAMAIRFLMDC